MSDLAPEPLDELARRDTAILAFADRLEAEGANRYWAEEARALVPRPRKAD